LHDSLSLGVLLREAAEGSGANLLLAVGEEGWLVDNSEHVLADSSALDSNSLGTLEGILLLGGQVLSDWN